eukprot:scaffold2274_cov82-Isochrysis_galbana.AAC.2
MARGMRGGRGGGCVCLFWLLLAMMRERWSSTILGRATVPRTAVAALRRASPSAAQTSFFT